jgi:protein-disulfide isomerase
MCSYCLRAHAELLRVISDHGDVRVVVKNMPLPMHGVDAVLAARATIAAKLQGNDYSVALYKMIVEHYGKWNSDDSKKTIANLMEYAKKIGLDPVKLEADMATAREVSEEMTQVQELAQKFGINGTPFLIVGDTAFPGMVPYEAIVNALK